MPSTIDALRVRRSLGRDEWGAPEPFGDGGWAFMEKNGPGSLLVTTWPFEKEATYLHASISGGDQMPSYEALTGLHKAVWGNDGYAYEIFAPDSQHVNLHPYARHLWGRVDGAPVLPEFGRWGTI